MNNNSIIFIGLDTHKSFIQVAVLQDHRGAIPIHYGRIKSNKSALIKLSQNRHSPFLNPTLYFVYEAGPCGYWTYRLLSSRGDCCLCQKEDRDLKFDATRWRYVE